MMKVLLALDLSRDSRAAALFLERLRIPAGSAVRILHVFTVPPVPLQGPAIPVQLAAWCKDLIGWAQRSVETIARRLAGQGLRVKTLIARGAPAAQILRTADRQQSDLIVMGSHGLTGLPLFLLGSVSEKILSHAACSVLLVRRPRRGRHDPRRGLRVVVAMDGSPEAPNALEFVEGLHLPPSSRLTLVHVFPTQTYRAAWLAMKGHVDVRQAVRRALLERKRQMERRLQQWQHRLETRGITAEVSFAEGHPAEEIVKVAKRQRAQLIVMSCRGLAGVTRFLIGSVSHQVARHAPCSVLVVRR